MKYTFYVLKYVFFKFAFSILVHRGAEAAVARRAHAQHAVEGLREAHERQHAWGSHSDCWGAHVQIPGSSH